MGICLQKTTFPTSSKSVRTSASKQSFLYNSFTYDPTYNNQLKFFFFDVPHYCQIQYILRKNNITYETELFKNNIKQHILQIDNFIKNVCQKGMGDKQRKFRKIKRQNSQQGDIQGTQYNSIQKQKNNDQNQSYNKNNILNFQLVSVTLQESYLTQTLNFTISKNQQKLLTISGNLILTKWKPSSTNKMSIPNTIIQFQNPKQQISIKILTQLGTQIAQCTIPCNKMTFKYIIPVLQTINIRSKSDNQPLGHIHFRIQYIKQYKEHCRKVVQDLQVRKKGLQSILERINNIERGQILDNYLVIDQNVSSFRSSIKEQSIDF